MHRDRRHDRRDDQSEMDLVESNHLESPEHPLNLDDLPLPVNRPLRPLRPAGATVVRSGLQIGGIEGKAALTVVEEPACREPGRRRIEQPLEFCPRQAIHRIRQVFLCIWPMVR